MATIIESNRLSNHTCPDCGTVLGIHTDGNCYIGLCEPLWTEDGNRTGRTSLCDDCVAGSFGFSAPAYEYDDPTRDNGW